jgi:hypothetical protein
MDQLTSRVWRAISNADALPFFLELLDGSEGPEVAESLREFFLDENEKVEWSESVPDVLQSLLTDSLELVEWELIARKWRDLMGMIEEYQEIVRGVED